MNQSKHLNARQVHGLQKIGNAVLPGDSNFPSFSASNCIRHVDRILDYMPESDLKDLKILLGLFSFFPCFMLSVLFWLIDASPALPGPIGSLLRLMRLGIRGLVFSLYYSDAAALGIMQYKVSVYTGDLAPEPMKDT